jgi:hypothetical protein
MNIQEINSYIKKNNLTNVKEADKEAVIKLLKKQHEMCSDILKELKINKKKKKHWAWYIFPTVKAGKYDEQKTYVTEDTVKILLEYAPDEWQLCLEKIIDLAIDKNNKLNEVLFDDDIGRVGYFVKFWKQILDKPNWLTNVCEDLDKILKGMSPIQRRQTSTNTNTNTSTSTEYLSLLIQKHFEKLNDIKQNL